MNLIMQTNSRQSLYMKITKKTEFCTLSCKTELIYHICVLITAISYWCGLINHTEQVTKLSTTPTLAIYNTGY